MNIENTQYKLPITHQLSPLNMSILEFMTMNWDGVEMMISMNDKDEIEHVHIQLQQITEEMVNENTPNYQSMIKSYNDLKTSIPHCFVLHPTPPNFAIISNSGHSQGKFLSIISHPLHLYTSSVKYKLPLPIIIEQISNYPTG